MSLKYAKVVEAVETMNLNQIDSLSRIRTEVALMRQDVVTVDFHITPSSACKSNNIKFLNIIEMLHMNRNQNLLTIAVAGPIYESVHRFDFHWTSTIEATGYPAVENYLQLLNLQTSIVADGEKLANGLLYDLYIYSLRRRDGLTCRPRCRYHLTGLTDIIVVEDEVISRSTTKFAVEVKPVLQMTGEAKINQALREAFIQLVGLNADNDDHSPPVVLTNLVGQHFVLYFDLGNGRYKLKIRKFDRFEFAIHYVVSTLMDRPSVTADLFRGPTPGTTPPDRSPEKRDDDDDDDDDDFDMNGLSLTEVY